MSGSSGLAAVLKDRLSDCNRQGAVLEALAVILGAVDAGMHTGCPMRCTGCLACIEEGPLRGCAIVRMSDVLDALHETLLTGAKEAKQAGDDE